jgi:methionyl-tRNA formyltransferase
MQLDRGMDTGPILLQRDCPIEKDDTTATLEPRLALMGAALLVETLAGLAAGVVVPKAQDESEATKAPLIKKTDGAVDFRQEASEIANRLRGFSPWPGLQFTLGGRTIKLIAANALAATSNRGSSSPGSILGISRDGLDIACGAGSILRLTRVQPESRGPMSAFDFANGSNIAKD